MLEMKVVLEKSGFEVDCELTGEGWQVFGEIICGVKTALKDLSQMMVIPEKKLAEIFVGALSEELRKE